MVVEVGGGTEGVRISFIDHTKTIVSSEPVTNVSRDVNYCMSIIHSHIYHCSISVPSSEASAMEVTTSL